MEEHLDQFERAIFQENESAAASSAAPAPVPTASTSFAEAVGLERCMKKRSKRPLTQDMEGLQHIICIHLFLKWYMFFKYCICVTNDIWFYTFKSYQRLGEAAKWNTNVDKGHPLIFYHDPGKHTEGSVTMYHQVGSKGFMKALSASFRSYRQRLIFLMLKRRSFLRGWRPFSVASISGNPHSQCPWLFRPADRVMPQTEAWENLWFLMFLSRFWLTHGG